MTTTRRTARRITTTLAALALTLGTASMASAHPIHSDGPAPYAAHHPSNVPSWVPTPEAHPCAVEDSDGPCYWDASTSGNGVGDSYYVAPWGPCTKYYVYPAHPEYNTVMDDAYSC